MEHRTGEDRRAMDQHPLTPRIEGVEKRLDRMEHKIDQIVNIETAIREMSIIATSNRKEMDKQWERIDDHTDWRSQHLANEMIEHKKICDAVDTIKADFSAWMNQDKGRRAVIEWAIGVIQVLLVASLSWQFNQIIVLNHQLTELGAKFDSHVKPNVDK